MLETFATFAFQGLLGIFSLLALLVYLAIITAAIMVVSALWRGMKAQERRADSMERIEKIVRRDEEPRV
jgi:hypothetical protein